MSFVRIPVEEQEPLFEEVQEPEATCSSRPRRTCAVLSAALALLVLAAALATAWHHRPWKPRELEDSWAREDEAVVHVDDQADHLIKTVYNPSVCFGKLSSATAWTANLGLKVTAATDECHWTSYRNDQTPFGGRRLEQEIQKLPSYKVLHFPASPWGLGMKRGLTSMEQPLSVDGVDLLPGGQSAYDLSDGQLRLSTRFGLHENWTLEGWHYLRDPNGCAWDSRDGKGPDAAGIMACFDGGYMQLRTMGRLRGGGNAMPEFPKSSRTVPLRRWAHLVWQRRGDAIEFYIDGIPAGVAAAPACMGVEDAPVSQAHIHLGHAMDEAPGDKYRGLLSNTRLTTASVYPANQTFTSPSNLELLPFTRFLLKDHCMDIATGRQMKQQGSVKDVLDPDMMLRSLHLSGITDDLMDHLNATGAQVLRTMQDNGTDDQSPIFKFKPRLRGAYCARTILTTIKDVATVVNNVLDATQACGNEKIKGISCAKAINTVVRSATSIGKYGSELETKCPQDIEDIDGYYKCSSALEGVAWGVDNLASAISAAVRECGPEDPDRNKLLDYGACAGEIASASAYVATAGLLITSGADYDCYDAKTRKEKKALRLDPEEQEDVRLECARDSTGAVRVMSLAASKAARAAGHCGGTDTLCGRSIARSAAALAGAAEVGTLLRTYCRDTTSCCKWNPDTRKVECECDAKSVREVHEDDLDDQRQCTRYSGSMIKLLSAGAALAAEAEGECSQFEETAEDTCQMLIPSAVAALGFLIENAARTSRDCPQKRGRQDQYYECGQEEGRVGIAMDVFSRSVGGAVVNCGLGNLPRVTKPISLPRRFFTP